MANSDQMKSISLPV